MIDWHVLGGAGLGLFITFVVAAFFGFGAPKQSSGIGGAIGFAFRAIAELVLFAFFFVGLAATAMVGTASSWWLFGGYAAVRIVALLLELLVSSGR